MAVAELEKIIIENTDDFNAERIFECGQAFRWNADESGAYFGIAYSSPAEIRYENGAYTVICRAGEYERVFKRYFDMERDYSAIRKEISKNNALRPACDFGKGIRILRQEPWEALCSFIISQCNNIPRIKKITESLCRLCGKEISFENKKIFAFPSAEEVSRLSQKELDSLRSGYRAAYIKNAANGVACGDINLAAIEALPTELAKAELLKIEGVGEKVASCTLLFGLGKLDAFPVDVWMKRAISFFFKTEKFDYKTLGPYAGLAQQYMFNYMRNGNIKIE